MLHDRCEEARRSSQVQSKIAAGSMLRINFVQPFSKLPIRGSRLKICRDVMQRGRKFVPKTRPKSQDLRRLAYPLAHEGAKLVVSHWRNGHPDHGKARRQEV